MKNTTKQDGVDPTSTSKRVVSFLNSSLGLWVLSTIFIGLITFTYQTWCMHSKAEHDKNVQIYNLETEISRRIYVFNKRLEELSNLDTGVGDYASKIEKAIKKVNSNDCYIFNEYRKRKLSTLLYELYVLLPEKNKPVAREAFEEMFLIEQFPSKIKKHTSSEQANDYLNKMLAFTKANTANDLWSK